MDVLFRDVPGGLVELEFQRDWESVLTIVMTPIQGRIFAANLMDACRRTETNDKKNEP